MIRFLELMNNVELQNLLKRISIFSGTIFLSELNRHTYSNLKTGASNAKIDLQRELEKQIN